VKTIFGWNKAALTAEKPATILKARKYADESAVFTSGALDSKYGLPLLYQRFGLAPP
jgi:hypothetical protein